MQSHIQSKSPCATEPKYFCLCGNYENSKLRQKLQQILNTLDQQIKTKNNNIQKINKQYTVKAKQKDDIIQRLASANSQLVIQNQILSKKLCKTNSKFASILESVQKRWKNKIKEMSSVIQYLEEKNQQLKKQNSIHNMRLIPSQLYNIGLSCNISPNQSTHSNPKCLSNLKQPTFQRQGQAMSRRKSKSPKINTQLTNKILGMGSGQNYQVGGGERFLTKSTENTFYNGDVRNPILDYDDMMTLRTEQKPSRRTNNSKNRNPKANFEMFKSKNIGIGSGIFANAEMNVNGQRVNKNLKPYLQPEYNYYYDNQDSNCTTNTNTFTYRNTITKAGSMNSGMGSCAGHKIISNVSNVRNNQNTDSDERGVGNANIRSKSASSRNNQFQYNSTQY